MRRDVVRHLQGAYGVGERRASSATGFRRSSHQYRSRRDPQVELTYVEFHERSTMAIGAAFL